jgi:predicted nucleic acid-binding protein
MPGVCYDTSVLISYRPAKPPSGHRISVVVLMEMTAGARDAESVKNWERTRKLYEPDGRLLVPTGEDWWLAGKVLNSLQRGRTSRRTGRIPPMSAAEIQRITRDVLIARTVKREGALLVTQNVRDFELIRQFCAVRIESGRDHFGHDPNER